MRLRAARRGTPAPPGRLRRLRGPALTGLRILLVDNYDSFTWNLAQYLAQLGADVDVRRNDAVSVAEAGSGRYAGIVISPGPGRPERAGVTESVVRGLAGRVPMLGVCLGHQAIAQVAGARIVRAPAPVHGKSAAVHHDGLSIYRGMPAPFPAGRYHSLVVERASVPAGLAISAETEDGLVMGLRRRLPGPLLEGVQFHPESILTAGGLRLMENFLAALD